MASGLSPPIPSNYRPKIDIPNANHRTGKLFLCLEHENFADLHTSACNPLQTTLGQDNKVAVEHVSRVTPHIYHNDHSRPECLIIRLLSEEIGRIACKHTNNPKWISGVTRHGISATLKWRQRLITSPPLPLPLMPLATITSMCSFQRICARMTC